MSNNTNNTNNTNNSNNSNTTNNSKILAIRVFKGGFPLGWVTDQEGKRLTFRSLRAVEAYKGLLPNTDESAS